MKDTSEWINTIAEAALDLPPAEQEAFLEAHCGSNEHLIADARRLLRLFYSVDGFLEDPPTHCCAIRPGDVLGGRFCILEELGSGATGTTFRAEDRQLGEVALKTLHPQGCGNGDAMARLRTEVRIARVVRHPNVRPVYDLFIFEQAAGDPMAAVTMQCLHGETLGSRLLRGPIIHTEALAIAGGIAAGLDALHAAGVLHRDLKPDNIMLAVRGDGSVFPVIMDFGLASLLSTESCAVGQACNAIAGSPDYMAPEQFRTADVTAAADIYAFGLILFEMITGTRPFPAEELLPAVIRRTMEDAPLITDVAPLAPPFWNSAVARALSRDASRRPRSSSSVIEGLQQERQRVEEQKTVRRCAHCNTVAAMPRRFRL